MNYSKFISHIPSLGHPFHDLAQFSARFLLPFVCQMHLLAFAHLDAEPTHAAQLAATESAVFAESPITVESAVSSASSEAKPLLLLSTSC
ncbi:hypothetical protein IEQ34_007711 [Dendrobium chrysotoxum]|uniref:Uncharacterized protein n=1 Tax=Dendrobium chrysotoxum TaxID=161865 RepID=A0AAV7H5P9_DENCH|nr:hypothetical protein IEQ34_007711 [Dendrobium chrysotoxum]